MRFSCLVALLLFLGEGCLCQTTSTPSASQNSSAEFASIAGAVTRLDTGEPLKKARVSVQSLADYKKLAYDITDDEGRFNVDKLEPGSYTLLVSRDGYISSQFGQRKIGGGGAVLELHPGQHLTDLTFKLARTAVLSGHVYDEDGEPVRNANLNVFRARGSQTMGYPVDRSVQTNDLGEFRVFDLPPGRYLVSAFYHSEEEIVADFKRWRAGRRK